MKLTRIVSPLFYLGLGVSALQAQISQFQHIVVIVQENRTPDNLFQGLCVPPFGAGTSCSTIPTASQYDIKTSNWLDKTSSTGVTQPLPVSLAAGYDLGHVHKGFVLTCDRNPATGICNMDGAAGIECFIGVCPSQPQFRFVKNNNGVLNPYLTLATQYGWANYMFQTNQGPSFPAHQFIFGGTSAPSAADDAAGIFVADQLLDGELGCAGVPWSLVLLIKPSGNESQFVYPCFEHSTVPDLLPSQVTWKYYAANAKSAFTAPNAIAHICQSTGPGGQCAGQEWQQNVDLTPADVLRDIGACSLRSVSWVTPTGANSDHPLQNDGGGPSWVTSIVNAIGTSNCDDNQGYWRNTAILIIWDDWGGWYDHEPPTILSGVEGDYQYGFRVPLLFVSAYTPVGYIDNGRHDFGSLLRFIEHNFGIAEGALNFADARSTDDLGPFFNLNSAARAFHKIAAPLDANFFLNDKRPATDPDDDN